MVYNFPMGGHEDRSPLIMKIALRQALGRLQEEGASLAQMEALAGNLGWEEVAGKLAAAREDLEEVRRDLQEAVEEAARQQEAAAHAHSHTHKHTHTHVHPHTHPHDHEHPGVVDGEHTHEHAHVHEHLHGHPHEHEH